MKVLVIPDVHLKPWMFDRASEIMKSGAAEKAICLMDIPDDWGQEYNLGLYENTFDSAIQFQKTFPDTLWSYGNHDMSYEWLQYESGFSSMAIPVVNAKLSALRRELPDRSQMAFIHRIDDVIFLHGGLTHAFVKYYANDMDYDDTDAVIEKVNLLGRNEMWDDASPLWSRPQYYYEKMYRESDILQVVGHTPVEKIDRIGNVISCDLFSTYRTGDPIGTQEFLLIDTVTWEYKGIK
ncbi:MAG: metallophosphoesterase [Mogibacterium sp.]|nr:metallophosphoesterase [Mogibacterium sp.]